MPVEIEVESLASISPASNGRQPEYNPSNPHPLSQIRGEFVWDGKYDEWGNRRMPELDALAMPLQVVETVDEPRARAEAQGNLFELQRSHPDDFRNRLIWGDNKLAAAALLSEFRGAVDLIYIDPPFNVGADFTLAVPIGDGTDVVSKDQSALEMVAYRDMWGRGAHSYLQTIFERVVLMRELLAETGSIFLHCDPTASHYLKLIMDEVFGQENFRNEITWKRSHTVKGNFGQGARFFGRNTDSILFYSKSERYNFNQQFSPYSDDYIKTSYRHVEPESGRRYRLVSMIGPGGASKGNPKYEVMGVTRYWRYSQERMQTLIDADLVVQTKAGGVPHRKYYLDEGKGVPAQSLWDDIGSLQASDNERLGYPTQKPEQLIERIIKTSTEEGGLVADFFAGSGTTAAVAERLGRRWIVSDLGRYSVHTTRKRMVDVQRELHKSGSRYRPFDVLNLGRYERQWWQQERLSGANEDHQRVVLEFYRAERMENSASPLIHGRKGPALCHVDDIDGIFTSVELASVASATVAMGGKELVCLAWEFEMGLSEAKNAIEVEHGLRVKLIQIPREIMEKNRTSPPPFLEVAKLSAEPVMQKAGGKTVIDIKLTEFVPSLAEVPTKELEALQERAIQSGFDFIDFWAVDFDFRHGQPFHHDWQDYRTRGDRMLKSVSDQAYEYEAPGTYTACVKVIDIFGADTSITLEVRA